MKYLLFLIALNGWAQLAYVNGAIGAFTSGGAGTGSVATAAFSVSSGSLLVCNSFWNNTTTTAVLTDTGGDTFTSAVTTTLGVMVGTSQQWYAANVSSEVAEVVTITFTPGGLGYAWLVCNQMSGADLSAPLDGAGSIGNGYGCATDQVMSGVWSTTNPNDIIIAGITSTVPQTTKYPGINSGGYTLGVGTSPGADNIFQTEYNIVSSTQTNIITDYGFVPCDYWQMVVGAYKQASGSSSAPPPQPFVIR